MHLSVSSNFIKQLYLSIKSKDKLYIYMYVYCRLCVNFGSVAACYLQSN